ncbi:DIRC2-like protein [Mya arenaria]|uniref:DIRC2-like protein n=1 Tax=Mya arenaria TaxID=6604 RepID=A0ABY7E9T8_MYAAR|nr:DIRC2-like protein [Mya arenaria]
MHVDRVEGAGEQRPLLNRTAIYPVRWYIIATFSYGGLTQAVLYNTWGPVTESSKAVFGWTDGTIAMFPNAANIAFIITVIPVSILADIKGCRSCVRWGRDLEEPSCWPGLPRSPPCGFRPISGPPQPLLSQCQHIRWPGCVTIFIGTGIFPFSPTPPTKPLSRHRENPVGIRTQSPRQERAILGCIGGVCCACRHSWRLAFRIGRKSESSWYFTTSMYVSSVLIGVFINGAVPLCFEITCETSYPVAEGVSGGAFTLLTNLVGVGFFCILLIKNISYSWMNWVLFGSSVLAVILLFFFPERYCRIDIDIEPLEDAIRVSTVVPEEE